MNFMLFWQPVEWLHFYNAIYFVFSINKLMTMIMLYVVILGAECCESVVASFCNCKCEHRRPGCMCLPAAQNCCRVWWHLTLATHVAITLSFWDVQCTSIIFCGQYNIFHGSIHGFVGHSVGQSQNFMLKPTLHEPVSGARNWLQKLVTVSGASFYPLVGCHHWDIIWRQ